MRIIPYVQLIIGLILVVLSPLLTLALMPLALIVAFLAGALWEVKETLQAFPRSMLDSAEFGVKQANSGFNEIMKKKDKPC